MAMKEYKRTYQNRARAELRDKVQAIKMAEGCVDCGYDAHPEALHFDHLPGHEKVHPIAVLVVRAASWERIAAEIAKCEVVCANCHAIRTANRRKNEVA